LPVAELVNGEGWVLPQKGFGFGNTAIFHSIRSARYPVGICFALLITFGIFSFDSQSLMKGQRPEFVLL
jgi:hypothetical protein